MLAAGYYITCRKKVTMQSLLEFCFYLMLPVAAAFAAAFLNLCVWEPKKLLFIMAGFTLLAVGARRSVSARQIMRQLQPRAREEVKCHA